MNWLKKLFGKKIQLPEVKIVEKQKEVSCSYSYYDSEPDWNWENSAFLHKQNLNKNTYPKWKHLLTKTPTYQKYINAFISVFKHHPDDCDVKILNGTYFVQTPDGEHVHGGFGYHTETPKTNDIYYTGCGCTWNTDSNGDRYHLIDYQTNLPYLWDEIHSLEIINRYTAWYLKNKQNLLRGKKIERILDKL